MDKYQKGILNEDYGFSLLPYPFSSAMTEHCTYNYMNEHIDDVLNVPISKLGKFWKFIEGVTYLTPSKDDELSITQSKGQSSACLVPILLGVEKVGVVQNGKETIYMTESSIFRNVDVCAIDFSFSCPLEKVILYFRHDMADPLSVKINTALYKEPEIDYKQLYMKNMSVSHSCGDSLVNIKFQNANDKVALTTVDLYSNHQLLGTYKAAEGVFFISITNLAYDKYSYIVKQYDKQGALIVESEMREFVLDAPSYGYGKNIVICP